MEGDVERLDTHLQSLKRRGANVLVLTDPSETTVCSQLLGSESMLRRRLLVRTHGDEQLDPTTDPTRFGLLDVPGIETRTALADTALGGDRPADTRAVEPQTPHRTTSTVDAPDWFSRLEPRPEPSLSTLARHLHDHLTRFEAADPDPGEIRVCFDSLDPLVDDVAYPRLHRFLHVVTARVRTARGIGHYHLSASVGREIDADFERLFDATVETRPSVSGPQQRWTLHEPGIQTDWLQLG
ncbi:hypothetical protein SAMN04487948_102412 [Halogranum amylolyticum]|uniref:RecA-superfamily ATPase, KaiC/GvpD/RAD55 family n=1 Tax=Halogranum amylolyticum TaxID=660520 RepID=A0A1H8PPN3_9EURY|nr:hypothetical protein [Halogranum amylolyticum]SEO43634.1 hypothetical protein SAMN04487948_102412 [Halogranum amylolyticum]